MNTRLVMATSFAPTSKPAPEREVNFSTHKNSLYWTTSRRALEASQTFNPLTNGLSFYEIVWVFKVWNASKALREVVHCRVTYET
jgi:hypothetical protein